MQGTPPDTSNSPFKLIIRQQPVHSRMCGIGERVDRRPIDPPPVVEIKMNLSMTHDLPVERLSVLSSHLFLIAVLVPADGREDQEQLNILLHSKLTVGRTVSSLYTLRDLDGSEGSFFVFSDISVRAEGNYRLRMCLFDIQEHTVNYNLSVLTEPFTVYSAKTFPGMYRSCPLVQNFAKQGLKIRIRKESGPRPSRYVHSKRKNIQKAIQQHETLMDLDEEEDELEEDELKEEEYSTTEVDRRLKKTHINHLLSHNPNEGATTSSAFKRLNSETVGTPSTKRRLSLSYLLDQNETLSHNTTTSRIDHCRLAPIITKHENTNPYTTYVKETRADDLPPIQSFEKPEILPSIQHYTSTELPPIQKHLHYIDKR